MLDNTGASRCYVWLQERYDKHEIRVLFNKPSEKDISSSKVKSLLDFADKKDNGRTKKLIESKEIMGSDSSNTSSSYGLAIFVPKDRSNGMLPFHTPVSDPSKPEVSQEEGGTHSSINLGMSNRIEDVD